MNKSIHYFFFLSLLLISPIAKAQEGDIQQKVDNIFKTALKEGQAYDYLKYLCKNIGPRLSGSPEAAAAVEYTRQVMDSMGLDSVWLEPVMVPHWYRGKQEKGFIIGAEELSVTALGNAVGTGPAGREGEVIEVKGLKEVEELGEEKIKGKIVFYNRPMDPTEFNTFAAYSGAADQRGLGPAIAAKYGAIAVIVRSLSISINDFPHTGSTKYQPLIPKIPAFGISTLDAEMLSTRLKNKPKTRVYLESHCQQLKDAPSFNVIGELRGTEKPDETFVVCGHLDSWDLGEGAHDDGAGCVQALEAIRILKHLNLRPKRTIRVVMFMNEENGLRGGRKFAENVKKNKENIFGAIEADMGGFAPRGFTCTGTKEQITQLQELIKYLEPWGVTYLKSGWGGVDISPLQSYGTVLFGLVPETQLYFDYHHSAADRLETVNPRELHLGAAALATIWYYIGEHGIENVKLQKD